MDNLVIYIKDNDKIVPDSFYYQKNEVIYRPAVSLHNQIKNIQASCTIISGPSENIPKKVNSNLFIILESNSLVPDDYLSRLFSMSNLHRDMVVSCGPRLTCSSRIAKEQHELLGLYEVYELDSFSSFISCKINDEKSNYPSIYGSLFSSNYYNSVGGYSEIVSPRGNIEKNVLFFDSLSKFGPMIYSQQLLTYKYLTVNDLEDKNILKWFYNQGYSDAMCGSIYTSTYIEILSKRDMVRYKSIYELGYNEGLLKCPII